MSKPKQILFKFRDGLMLVKEGDQVWEVDSHRSMSKLGQLKYVRKVGNKLITIGHTLLGDGTWRHTETQYYAETGRVKSEYNLDISLYSSEEACERVKVEQVTIDKCAQAFGTHYAPRELTYDKACRILKILEET